MSSDKLSDRNVYVANTSQEAEVARRILLSHKPRPCVYVYIKESGFDVNVSSEWGTAPSDNFVLELKQFLIEEMAKE